MSDFLNKRIYKLRVVFLMLFDIIAVQLAMFFALYIRCDFKFEEIDVRFIDSIVKYSLLNTIIVLFVFFVFKLYSSIWKYASIEEMIKIILANITFFCVEILEMIFIGYEVPRSHPFICTTILLAETIFSRFGYRILRIAKYISIRGKRGVTTMIIGAGQAATILIKEIKTSQYTDYNIKCVIDDDEEKIGKYISGIKIVGDRSSIVENVKRYKIQQIIVAMPSAGNKVIKEILDICKQTDCILKKIPGIYQLVDGSVSINDIKNVDIEDLLGREEINVELELIMDYVKGKKVLVTGGGGSIGSELCRQVAMYNPEKIIIFDIYENGAYEIEQELKKNYPNLDILVLIGSVRNKKRLEQVFEAYRPDIVYHAAAHKHVPLMEISPNEAIKNNVFGTYNTALTAGEFETEKFVLISTDKAVNPTNIMGASKRVCEMIIQMLDGKYENTNFVSVRFGNVLGSNGSVIPLFEKQIKSGGPITITHPDIIRYFMTISEAVSLVLQAGSYARGGEIFVLDMGEPVKILDLAKNMIRLSGYSEEDIEIKFTGLRPGEKLYEELLMKEEGLKETENKLIYIGSPIDFDEKSFLENLDKLKEVCKDENTDVRKIVTEMIGTYNYVR